MKRLVVFLTFCILLLFSSLSVIKAQDGQLILDLSYPIQVGDTFYSNYDGIIASDLTYRHQLSSRFHLNGKIGYSRTSFDIERHFGNPMEPTYANIYRVLFGPTLNYKVTDQIYVVPELSIGYAHVRFSNDDAENSTDTGINSVVGFSIEFHVWKNVGLGLYSSYDFIYLGEPENAINTAFNKEMHSIKTGIRIIYSL